MAEPLSSPAANDRLDSWKEIAAYLKRGVRTLQRWERTQGLPVYRHQHAKRGSVYAYRAELDQWWHNHGSQLEPENGEAEPPRHRRGWIGASLALGVLAAAGWWIWQTRWPGASPQPVMRQMASFPFPYAKVSLDGDWLVHVEQVVDERRLLLKDLRSGQSRILLPEWVGTYFAWSPDSRRVALIARHSRGVAQLETLEIASGTRKVIWRGPGKDCPLPLDWSRDGRKLLCRIGETNSPTFNGNELVLVSVADGGVTPILKARFPIRFAQLSPDGRLVAYDAKPDNEDHGIFLVRANGSGNERLTGGPSTDWSPVWSTDGRRLLFVRVQRTHPSGLWGVTIDPETRKAVEEPHRLNVQGEFQLLDRISRTGELFFHRREVARHVFFLPVDPETGRLRGEPRSPLPAATFDPNWSSSGKGLFYRRFFASELFELNLDTGAERSFSIPSGYVPLIIAASPDGSRLAFHGMDPSHKPGFYAYQPETGNLRTLWKTDHYYNHPMSWSPDGRELLFERYDPPNRQHLIQVLPGSGGEPRLITKSHARPFPRWSPDGKLIAFSDGSFCLMTISRRGGPVRSVACASSFNWPKTSGAAPRMPGQLDWSPDGRKIAWTVHNEQEKRLEMWIVDHATGQHVTAWTGEAGYRTWPDEPRWSPDGSQIAFTLRGEQEYQIWALSQAAAVSRFPHRAVALGAARSRGAAR